MRQEGIRQREMAEDNMRIKEEVKKIYSRKMEESNSLEHYPIIPKSYEQTPSGPPCRPCNRTPYTLTCPYRPPSPSISGNRNSIHGPTRSPIRRLWRGSGRGRCNGRVRWEGGGSEAAEKTGGRQVTGWVAGEVDKHRKRTRQNEGNV